MVNPLEVLLDPVSLSFTGIYALMMLWEYIFPARKLPFVRFWYIKGILTYLFFLLLSTYFPLMCEALLPQETLIDLKSVDPLIAAVIGILIYEFGLYVWHRSMHNNTILWRIFHQMHHSAERLDTYGAFYFSPMDMIGFAALGTVCFSFVVALSAPAITIMLLVTNFFSVFQHANIKTPQWLGYIVQRPESHSVHHSKGVHAFNYSDLPAFDILFGTFRNPQGYTGETGFYQGASSRIFDMLRFKEISTENKNS